MGNFLAWGTEEVSIFLFSSKFSMSRDQAVHEKLLAKLASHTEAPALPYKYVDDPIMPYSLLPSGRGRNPTHMKRRIKRVLGAFVHGTFPSIC